MRSSLTIDQGNSVAKVTLFDSGKAVAEMRSKNLTVEETAAFLGAVRPEGAIYSSVAHFDIRLVESLRQLVEGPVIALTHSTPLPIRISYSSPDTLGLDRIAAAAGAAQLMPGHTMLVADLGTALTTDIIDCTGTFRGGNISPGLRLRLRSLHTYTDRLPEVSKEGPAPLFGYDTETAIRSGALRGTAAEITGAFRAAQAEAGADTLIVTGGDSGLLLTLLREQYPSTLHVPGLVAQGLNRILEYNEDN